MICFRARASGLLLACAEALALAVPRPLPAADYPAPLRHTPQDHPAQRVILVNVDGLHALDLANWVAAHPTSTLAELSARGVTYTNARTPWSGDAAGLLALATGGTPISTGILSDDGYDRSLSPPGSNCEMKGAAINLGESAEFDAAPADPRKLPLDPLHGCEPVLPHSLAPVNNIFELVRAAGGRTAWADRPAAYADLLNGRSGKGIDDLYAPEQDASGRAQSADASADLNLASDDLRVAAMLRWIDGRDSAGKRGAAVPELFGMTFASISVAQEARGGGYADGIGTPGALLERCLERTDGSLGRIAAEVKKRGLFDSTWIIVAAARGASPMDPEKLRMVPSERLAAVADSVRRGIAAHMATGTAALIWLRDPARTNDVVNAYRGKMGALGIQEIYSGQRLRLLFGEAAQGPRMPDIILQPQLGVVWAATGERPLAGHGGMGEDDTHVALLVSGPQFTGRADPTWEPTSQVAPLILRALGMEKLDLRALRTEHTPALPGIF